MAVSEKLCSRCALAQFEGGRTAGEAAPAETRRQGGRGHDESWRGLVLMRGDKRGEDIGGTNHKNKLLEDTIREACEQDGGADGRAMDKQRRGGTQFYVRKTLRFKRRRRRRTSPSSTFRCRDGRGGGKAMGFVASIPPEQRPLTHTLSQHLITASGAWFCLLCGQPEPLPRSLTARAELLTRPSPCRPLD